MRRWHIGRGILVGVVCGALALPLLCGLAIVVAPNRTPDGHPTMPIGQAAFGMLGAPIIAAVAGFYAARPNQNRNGMPTITP